MRKRITLKRFVPFLLLAIWVVLALWVEFLPANYSTTSEIVHNFFKRIDYLIYDVRQLSTLKKTDHGSYPIAIVAIDNQSIQKEGRWPWSYYKIANLIAKLRDQGASVIAFDVVFNQPEKNMVTVIKKKLMASPGYNPALLNELTQIEPSFDDNSLLINQVKDKNDVVLSFLLNTIPFTQGQLPNPIAGLDNYDLNNLSILNMPGYITNFAGLQSVSLHNGFVSMLTDEDGVVRRKPLVLRHQDKVYASLPLAVAQVLLHQPDIKLNIVDVNGAKYLDSIQLGEREIPTDKAGRVLIPFQGKAYSYPYYSATEVLRNKLKAGTLKDRVVLVGATAEGITHVSNTSVDNAMPDVEVYANILTGILSNQFPHLAYWAKAATIGLVLFIGIILTLLLPRLSPGVAILSALFILTSLIAANIWLWVAKGIVFAFAVPFLMTIMLVLTNMAYGFLFESRRKKFLIDAFSQYVAPEHVQILMDNPEKYSLAGETVELTVLFADIRDFTTISENMPAESTKKLLNEYFTPMTQIIFNHGGTIDKYVGDMIMAFWGAPIKNQRHREAAIDAALDILAKSEELKVSFLAAGFPEINIGIGLNTGIMNVGDMGSVFRRSYTVLGDAVNLGSRLESLSKFYGVKLIVGSATKTGQTKFLFRLIDKVKVKGKREAVAAYEVICRMSEATPALLEEVAAHEEAISAYFKADWKLASTLFANLAAQHPNTVVYKLFLDRIAFFQAHPPAPDWDGSYERTEK